MSPLLFSLFINDLATHFRNSNCLLLADDTKIYKKIICLNDAKQLQEDFNHLFVWCNDNDMTLNIDKCAIVSFSLKINPLRIYYCINNLYLSRKNIIKDLGVNFDSKLSFKNYVDHLKNK
jgi:hypothetical protein